VTAVVVDTNVLVVANERTAQAPATCVRACAERLRALIDAGTLVLDDQWRIIREYQRQASSSGEPGLGDAFLKWALINRTNPQRCDLVALTLRGDGDEDFEEFPDDPALGGFDRSDRKFVAVARASTRRPPVVNATDTDWWLFREPLQRHGVRIIFLCPDLMEASDRRGS
jgi:hypothetical protein